MSKTGKPRSIRPRLQRAFLAWLRENKGRFLIPIRVSKRTEQCIDLSLLGISETISVYLSQRELAVMVTRNNEYVDFLLNEDICRPNRVAGGYVANWQPEEDQTVFPTREALWQDHIFESLLKWVNQKLAPARWIRMYRVQDGGLFGANLINSNEGRYQEGALGLLGGLLGPNGQRLIEPDHDCVEFWIYPVDGNELAEHFVAIVGEK